MCASLDLGALATLERVFYRDKVVLCFEGPVQRKQVVQWIEQYNNQHTHSFLVFEQIANALYVITIINYNLKARVKDLLKGKPLKLKEHDEDRANQANLARKAILLTDKKTSVNAYYPNFDPKNPIDFKHLVTIQITKGDSFCFFVLDSLLYRLGKVARKYIGPSTDRHKIIVVVETTFKRFKDMITFCINASQIEEIPFSIIDKQPRYFWCFSTSHPTSLCFKLIGGPSHRGKSSINLKSPPRVRIVADPQSRGQSPNFQQSGRS